jgi:TRAP transporter TAXI family solute receptor
MILGLRVARWRAVAGAIALVLAAAAPLSARAQQQDQQALRFFRIGTAASVGSYFPVGGLIASAISSPPGARPCDKGGSCGVPGLIAVAQSTRGSVENVQLIGKGQLESGLCQADIAYAAYKGTGRFAKAPVHELRAIANLYPEAMHIVVRADSEITSIPQLKGKRLSAGEEGSGTLVDAEAILAAYKVRRKDVHVRFLTPGQASDALRAKEIDAFFLVAGTPVRAVAELADQVPIRLLPISEEALARLRRGHPFLGAAVIPAGTYKDVEEADTVSVGAEWVTSSAVDADLIYGVTKALWEKSTRKLLEGGPPEAKQIRLETALDGLPIPLHPGAERFYREIGVLKPTGTK